MQNKSNSKTGLAAGEVIASTGILPITGVGVDVMIAVSNLSAQDVVFGIQVTESDQVIFYLPWAQLKNSSSTIPFAAGSFVGSGLRFDVVADAAITGKVAAAVTVAPVR